MTDFPHSIVLFCGEDGLPLEFNIRNTTEKVRLKALIEYGGGLCTQSDNAVHLISPGTKVLNADLGKKLVSSRYILDCVKENYLLDVNDYVFTVSEAETSDISDDESNQAIPTKQFRLNIPPFKESLQCVEDPVDITSEDDENLKVAHNDTDLDFTLQIVSRETMKELNSSVASSESFIESSIQTGFNPKSIGFDHRDIPFTSTAKEPEAVHISENLDQFEGISPIQGSQSIVHPEVLALYKRGDEEPKRLPNKEMENVSVVETVVSSSQQAMDALDHFDNLLLNKIQQKPELEVEETLSQSCTVSSSGDAQMSSIPPSVECQPCEGAESVFPASDSLGSNLLQNRHLYIKKLESDIEKILKKPSPKSLQDKISLVKYICCVKKLPPSIVLTSLQSL